MKKRILAALLTVTLTLSLTACGDNNSSSRTSPSASLPSASSGDSNSGGTGFQKNMAQSFSGSNNPCESENGYYFVGYQNNVYYVDKKTGNTTILCGKPECNHNNENCNACAGAGLTYYNGKLYYVRDRSPSDMQLYSMNLDGTEHTAVQSLNVGSSSNSYVGHAIPIIYKGTVYFLYSAVLYAVPLGADISEAKAIYGKTEQAEVIGGAVYDSINEPRYTLWADGDIVYFMTNVKQTDGTYKDTLFAYDTQTSKVTQVWEIPDKTEVGAWDTTGVKVSGWYVTEGYIYFYLSGGDLWRSSLSSGTAEKIADVSEKASHGNAYYSDDYIVIGSISNPHDTVNIWESLLVYDYNGKLLNEIALDSLGSTYNEDN